MVTLSINDQSVQVTAADDTPLPAGLGIGFNPPRYLARGHEISMEISGLGRLVNKLL